MEASQGDQQPELKSPGGETGLEEPFWQLGLGGRDSYPERPGVANCLYYMRTGTCGYGARCRFNHPRDRGSALEAVLQGGEYPEREGQPVCQYFLKTGTCKFGPSCRYHHPKDGGGSTSSVDLNYHGYPLRPGEKECSYYKKTGLCNFGVDCKFHHPQPAGTSLPAPAPVPAFYQRVQSPESPVASPTTHQLNAVVGSLYEISQLSPSAPAYGLTYQPVSSPAGPSSGSQQGTIFPERPGQPECQYYMRTGDCKFGSSCKFHHPPERITPNTNYFLGSIGLPLHPIWERHPMWSSTNKSPVEARSEERALRRDLILGRRQIEQKSSMSEQILEQLPPILSMTNKSPAKARSEERDLRRIWERRPMSSTTNKSPDEARSKERALCQDSVVGRDQIEQNWLLDFHQFCTLFPVNHEMDWNQTEQLFMAGPIVHKIQLEKTEDFRSVDIYAYFEGVKSRLNATSLLDKNPYSSNGSSQVYCRVEDINDASSGGLSTRTLHASFVLSTSNIVSDPKKIFDALQNSPNLQTLLLFGEHKPLIHQVPREFFVILRDLKILDLSWTNITELPSSFGNLVSLRYLDVSGTPITRLPNSICGFQDMQTLRLRHCFQLVGLPKDLRKLSKLLHLDMDIVSQLTSMPPGIGSLTQLRTLPAFIVGKSEGCHVTELNSMTNLQGTLSIVRLENMLQWDQATQVALCKKKYLEKLELEWTESSRIAYMVLQYLEPHMNIKELRLVGYEGSKFPTWIGDPYFSNLITITLCDCTCSQCLPPLGKLPQLRTLHISEMRGVQRIDDQLLGDDIRTGAFWRLNSLVLHSLPDLVAWTGIKKGDFPVLSDLKLSCCPKLTTLPELWLLSSLKHLEISLCSQLPSLPILGDGVHPPLQSLRIIDCTILKQLCSEEFDDGNLSATISYIPSVIFMD